MPREVRSVVFDFWFMFAFALSTIGMFAFLPTVAAGTGVFTKEDKPFGISYDDWISRYWNWEFSLTNDTAQPRPNSCLMHKSSSMIMVYNPADGGKYSQECTISDKEGIMIPLWSAYCDNTNKGHENDSFEQLTKCAREEYDQGRVTAKVEVDGTKVAELNEDFSMATGSPEYRVYSLINVNELYSKGFILTVPENSSRIGYFPEAGNYRSGGHGWYVFLKPLSVGDHSVVYNLQVEAPYYTSAEVTYIFHVK